MGRVGRDFDLEEDDEAGEAPERPQPAPITRSRWPSIGPAIGSSGGRRAALYGPDAQGDGGSGRYEGEDEEDADEDDSAGADGRSEPAAGRRGGVLRQLSSVGSKSKRRASVMETSDLRDRLKVRTESVTINGGGIKVGDGDDGGEDDPGGEEAARRRRNAGEGEEAAEEIDDDAMNSNLSDYKRGKRLKKLVKLLGSAQVCVFVCGVSVSVCRCVVRVCVCV